MNASKAATVYKLAIWLVVIVFVGMILAGGPDEVEAERQQYCNNVRDGIWPDYDAGRYKLDCGGKDPPKFNEEIAK